MKMGQLRKFKDTPLGWKIDGTVNGIFRWLYLLPIRIIRVLKHPFNLKEQGILQWLLEWPLLVLDLSGLFDLYEILCTWCKWHTKPLTQRQRELAKRVFGSSMNLDAVRIDYRARIGTRRGKMAYVSFATINCFESMRDPHLIHELVHIWQYERVGAVYIVRAILAQLSEKGYDYGGKIGLLANKDRGLEGFNYEQQGDIAADFYKRLLGLHLQWSVNAIDPEFFKVYIDEFRST